jgi:hypothetical protein
VLFQSVTGYSAAYPILSYHQLLKDFTPLYATVIELSGYSVIIDKGKADDVNSGDLFQLYGKGEQVIDTDDGKIVGYIKKPLATIRVTQTQDTKSICEIVSALGPLNTGQPAMRYSDMTAAFVARSHLDVAYELSKNLEQTFPNLMWLNPSDIPSSAFDSESMKTLGIVLLFALEQDGLKVYGPDLDLLHEYPISSQAIATKGQEDFVDIIDKEDRKRRQGNAEETGKFRTYVEPFDLGDARLLGRLSEKAIQIDILDLDGDGEDEIVYLLSSGIYVGHYGSPGELASFRFFGPGRLVSFSAKENHGWIAVNALLDEAGMNSMLLNYENFTLNLVQEDINLWLAFVDRDGDGSKDSLLGQNFDTCNMFGPKVYLIEPSYEGLRYKQQITKSENFNAIRSGWADLNGNGLLEVCVIDHKGKLCVYELDKLLWSSPNRVSPQLPENGLPKWLISVDMDGNGLPELLFPGVPSKESTLMGNWLMSLRWEDGEYILKSIMRPVEASICGIVVYKGQLIIGISRPDKKFEEKGESFLYLLREL